MVLMVVRMRLGAVKGGGVDTPSRVSSWVPSRGKFLRRSVRAPSNRETELWTALSGVLVSGPGRDYQTDSATILFILFHSGMSATIAFEVSRFVPTPPAAGCDTFASECEGRSLTPRPHSVSLDSRRAPPAVRELRVPCPYVVASIAEDGNEIALPQSLHRGDSVAFPAAYPLRPGRRGVETTAEN